MRKETILAKLRVVIHFSDQGLQWFEEVRRVSPDAWFADEGGMRFMSEFRGTWNNVLVESTEPILRDFFSKIGIQEDNLPKVKVYESYPGSWIIEAAIVMFTSIGMAYTILKGVSELPKIADGLTDLKSRLKKEFQGECSSAIGKQLRQSAKQQKLPAFPKSIISSDFMIDARPLLALTPSLMKSHKIHTNVSISRDAFTLENLGEEVMRNIRIGLFKSLTERHQWSYTDSYMAAIDILSPKQTITKALAEFQDGQGMQFALDENTSLYIDCWVQDTHGIYLFNFFVEG